MRCCRCSSHPYSTSITPYIHHHPLPANTHATRLPRVRRSTTTTTNATLGARSTANPVPPAVGHVCPVAAWGPSANA
jgi:hypothetical protein